LHYILIFYFACDEDGAPEKESNCFKIL